MIDEKLINEAERLLKKYEQIDSYTSKQFQSWLHEFIKSKNVNCESFSKCTLLMATVKMGEIYFARLLLENGALVNFQRDDGYTALMFAVEKKNVEMIKLLLSFGADTIGLSILDYVKYCPKEIFNLLSGNHECEENDLDEEEDLKEEVKRVIKM